MIEEIEKQLQLTEAQTRPSKEALYRFGNTSSSSIYYELSCESRSFNMLSPRSREMTLRASMQVLLKLKVYVRDTRRELSFSAEIGVMTCSADGKKLS